jgi:hypothetical protein
LPDVRLDGSSDEEAVLIRSGLPYLHEVFSSTHWRVFEVLGSLPLASAPARLVGLDHDSFTLRFSSAGESIVRLHYTRYWSFSQGHGCLGLAPGGWTSVKVNAPGVVHVAARFSLARGLGLAAGCG